MRMSAFLPAVIVGFEFVALFEGKGDNGLTSTEEKGQDSYDVEHGSENSAFQPHSPYKEVTQFDFVDDSGNGAKKDKLPLILWWTPSLFPHAIHKNGVPSLVKCGLHQCLASVNRTLLKDQKTRGVLFYGTDLDPFDLPLPRKARHEWALLHEESPLNNFMLSHFTFIKLFNHTATFRRESDYPLSSQYLYSLEYLTQRKPIAIEIKNENRKPPNSYAPVLYVQSHCGVASDRDRYVKELMKYIPVDSYGKCLHNRDLPEKLRDPASSFEKEEFLNSIAKYKFHLAFENAICNDYMTEKLFRCLHLGSVPIYMGSPVAEDWMPDDKSIIMAQDFESPKELADYLDFLDKNDEEYLKYLRFKTPSGVTNQFLLKHMEEREWRMNDQSSIDFIVGFECHVCKKLNKRLDVRRAHKRNTSIPLLPPKSADNSHFGCPQPYTSIGHPADVGEGDSWLELDWIGQYWGDLDKAYAVRDMLAAKERDPSKFDYYWTKFVQKHDVGRK